MLVRRSAACVRVLWSCGCCWYCSGGCAASLAVRGALVRRGASLAAVCARAGRKGAFLLSFKQGAVRRRKQRARAPPVPVLVMSLIVDVASGEWVGDEKRQKAEHGGVWTWHFAAGVFRMALGVGVDEAGARFSGERARRLVSNAARRLGGLSKLTGSVTEMHGRDPGCVRFIYGRE